MTVLPPMPGYTTNPTSGAVIPSLPSTTKALQRKYTTLGPQLSAFPSPIVNSLIQFDTQRAMRGAQPLSKQQTAAVLASALTGQAATPPPDRSTSIFSIPGNAVHDLQQIVTSIPRLPRALYQEAKALPSAPAQISKALSAGSPSKVIAGLTETPGLRLIPGAYTAHNLATGQADEALRHPLMTLLDLYPAAKSAGLTEAVSKQVSTVAGRAAASPLGQEAIRGVKGNAGVQFVKQAFGKDARADASRFYHANKTLQRAVEDDPAIALKQKYASLTPEQHSRVSQALELGDSSIYDTLTPVEQALHDEYKLTALPRVTEMGIDEGLVAAIDNYGGAPEVLDVKTAAKFRKKQRLTEIATQEADIRSAILEPTTDIASLTEKGAIAALAPKSFFTNNAQRTHYLQGVTHALDSAGVDATPLRAAIQSVVKRESTWDDLAQTFRDYPSTATQRIATPDPAAIIDTFSAQARQNPKMAQFIDQLKRGNYSAALDHANGINKRTRFLPDNWDEVLDSVRQLNTRKKFLDRPPVFSDKAVARALRSEDKFVTANPPARFKPAIIKRAEDDVVAQFPTTDPDFPAIIQAVTERNYSQYPGLADIMQSSVDDIAKTWQTLRSDGLDPVFIHHVTPSSANKLTHPTVLGHTTTENWVNRRTLDVTPYVQDATVGLSHQAMETLQRIGTQAYLDDWVATWGRHAESTLNDRPPLIEDFIEPARRRFPDDPSMVRAEAERLMKKQYAVFDPNSILPKGSRLTNFGSEPIWVPKNNLRNLERMHTPLSNGFTAIMDPIMKVFRTSLLPLSPRWQINNIAGGGMIAAVDDPMILTYVPKAIAMFRKNGEVPEYVQKVADRIGIGTGIGSVPRESLEWNATAATTLFQHSAGKTLARLYEQTGSAREAASNFVQKAYKANEFMDDTYRAAAFMRGYDKALTKGLSKVEAEASGVNMARRILQRWDEMTPIERSVMRYTFPFYGWVAQIMPYVLKYPFDHPWRAAIMSSFTRNEIADQGTGLPERFLNAFFLGNPDSSGNIKAIQTGGMNPFGGVANYFTWAGFTGNVNPVIGSVLEALGVDTMNGGPELYPDLEYDPESGRLVTRGQSFIPTLLGNVIPQSRILTDLFSTSSEFKEMLKSNPEAAARRMMSQAGLPIIYRNYNLPQEQFKAELARENAQSEAKSKALKSGDISSLNKYPALRGYVAQLQALRASGQLRPYQPNVESSNLSAALKQALIP